MFPGLDKDINKIKTKLSIFIKILCCDHRISTSKKLVKANENY
ncbi:MAG: hypothetical protein RLZZ381_2416 [Cyanobacteriota bacterium]|jgi:hypothetical protein